MIATIRKGHKLHANDGRVFTVIGSQSFRSGYCYIVKDANGVKSSVSRADVLKGQQIGTVRVTA